MLWLSPGTCKCSLHIHSKSSLWRHPSFHGKPYTGVAAAQAVVSFQMNHEGFTSCKTSLESLRVWAAYKHGWFFFLIRGWICPEYLFGAVDCQQGFYAPFRWDAAQSQAPAAAAHRALLGLPWRTGIGSDKTLLVLVPLVYVNFSWGTSLCIWRTKAFHLAGLSLREMNLAPSLSSSLPSPRATALFPMKVDLTSPA